MAKFIFISKRNEELNLLNNDYFYLTNLEGQNSATVSISSVVNASFDGDTITNSITQPRTLTLNFVIKQGVNVELAKREILKIIKIKQSGAIRWKQNDREVIINGIIESVEFERWTNKSIMQISMHCSNPYWEDIENVVQLINQFVDLHYFTTEENDMLYFPDDGIPFGMFDTTRIKTFTNNGDVEIGIEIRIVALSTVTNPKIFDTYGNFFGLKKTMNAGEEIVITTHKGNKTVKKNNGENLFNKILPKSKWLTMETGDNVFRIESDDMVDGEKVIDNLIFNLIYKQRYI